MDIAGRHGMGQKGLPRVHQVQHQPVQVQLQQHNMSKVSSFNGKFRAATEDPLDPETGDFYYNTTTNIWKQYNGADWLNFPFVTDTTTSTSSSTSTTTTTTSTTTTTTSTSTTTTTTSTTTTTTSTTTTTTSTTTTTTSTSSSTSTTV